MDSRALLAALKRKREKTVDLGDGKKVFFLRPAESEMASLLSGEGETRTWAIGVDHVRKCVTGWDGFTEVDILGAGVGASDPVPFDADLWAELCGDDIAWVRQVADAILKSVVDHLQAEEAAAKNSVPA
jgi:hypothetical protein